MTFADRYGPWALVTGASAGIGAAFAGEIAARGVNVALVARGQERLERVAAEIKTRHGVDTLAIAVDLCADDFLTPIIEALDLRHIGLLVNNAGTSLTGGLLDHELDAELKVQALNCRAPLILTHHFGRIMRADRRGGIVMVSSLAGIVPSPQFTHYGATKAWNRFFGEGLHEELGHDNVDVVSLCPGLTESELSAQVNVELGEWPMFLRAGVMTAEAVARAGLNALGHQSQVVPGLPYRMLMRARRLVPEGLPPWLVDRMVRFAMPARKRHD